MGSCVVKNEFRRAERCRLVRNVTKVGSEKLNEHKIGERARKRRDSKVAFSEAGGCQLSSLSSLHGSERRSS